MARLAQSAERKALNLVVVGSSPTVGVLFLVSFGDKPAGANCQTANPHEKIKEKCSSAREKWLWD